MDREVTMEELVKLVKDQEGDFIIHISSGEEADTDAKEE
jgi:hypothetical protein